MFSGFTHGFVSSISSSSLRVSGPGEPGLVVVVVVVPSGGSRRSSPEPPPEILPGDGFTSHWSGERRSLAGTLFLSSHFPSRKAHSSQSQQSSEFAFCEQGLHVDPADGKNPPLPVPAHGEAGGAPQFVPGATCGPVLMIIVVVDGPHAQLAAPEEHGQDDEGTDTEYPALPPAPPAELPPERCGGIARCEYTGWRDTKASTRQSAAPNALLPGSGRAGEPRARGGAAGEEAPHEGLGHMVRRGAGGPSFDVPLNHLPFPSRTVENRHVSSGSATLCVVGRSAFPASFLCSINQFRDNQFRKPSTLGLLILYDTRCVNCTAANHSATCVLPA